MRLLGAKELAAVLPDEGAPCSVRLGGSIECAEVLHGSAPVILDNAGSRPEATPVSGWHHATRKLSVVTSVPSVLLDRGFAQVAPSVVGWVAVLVIERLWPFAGAHNPDQAVRGELALIHENTDVSVAIGQPGSGAREAPVPSCLGADAFEMVERALSPDQRASPRVVREALSEINRVGALGAITRVLDVCRLRQIVPAVVSGISVLMLEHARPTTRPHKPDQAMSRYPALSDHHKASTVCPWDAGFRAAVPRVPAALRSLVRKVVQWSGFPCQSAGRRIVRKALLDVFQFGQRRRRHQRFLSMESV